MALLMASMGHLAWLFRRKWKKEHEQNRNRLKNSKAYQSDGEHAILRIWDE